MYIRKYAQYLCVNFYVVHLNLEPSLRHTGTENTLYVKFYESKPIVTLLKILVPNYGHFIFLGMAISNIKDRLEEVYLTKHMQDFCHF
jgi:hypothetical protein